MNSTSPESNASPSPSTSIDLATASASDIIDILVNDNHASLRCQLDSLQDQVAAAATDTARPSYDINRIAEIVTTFRDLLFDHIDREEQIVFPLIRILELRGALPLYSRPSVDSPVASLETDHDQTDEVFSSLRELTNGYSRIGDSQSPYNTLVDSLSQFEGSMQKHMDIERTYLFARICSPL